MEQSRLESFIEAALNTLSGFLLSYIGWMLVIVPIYHLPFNYSTAFGITCFFTVLSISRSYFWRRFFNAGAHKLAQAWAMKIIKGATKYDQILRWIHVLRGRLKGRPDQEN